MNEKENKSKNKGPNVVGTFEAKRGRWTHRFDFLENGVVEGYRNIKERERRRWWNPKNWFKDDGCIKAKWKIVDGELHLLHQDGNVEVARINSDGIISFIAFIVHWVKRYALSKKKHGTWKKSSSSMPAKNRHY